jgi:hypothetical protein
MPANWGTFIPDLTNTLLSQKFTKPGGSEISYKTPEIGATKVLGKDFKLDDDGNPVPFAPISIIGGGKTPLGNPANAVLATNPATMVNANDKNPLSGRYDFGKQVAQHYLDAVKGLAQTHVGETHTNNPGAETILKEGYGIAFERLLREGDIPLQDQYDEDGNLIEMGKESHPAYADFCPEVEEPDAEAIAALEIENNKAFNAFASGENIQNYNLYKFKFYQFPCLSGAESQEELEVVFANRILMGYEFMTSANERWEYFVWVCHLGKENYNGSGGYNNSSHYKNLNSKCRQDIEDAGYDYKLLADNVSAMCKAGILAAHPKNENDWPRTGTNSTLEVRIKRPATKDIEFPKIINEDEVDVTPAVCPINPYKMQIARDFEKDSDDYVNQRPKILTMNVVATFTYYPGMRGNYSYGTNADAYVINNEKALFKKNCIEYDKSNNWVKNKYRDIEYKKKWRRCPPEGKLDAAARATDDLRFMGKSKPGYAFLALGWNGDNFSGGEAGTQYKFEYHRVLCAIRAAENCEEPMTEVPHPWDPSGTTPGGKSYSGDPYMMMARVTIAYWYACIVKPFTPTPSAPPALIPAPLTGIYIPIYYGSANRLANNLRRAWNTGKSFATPGTQQPASQATATAVAGAYALHLLEFKLLYLGGIPTPAGPVPMVGFVPIVF